MVVSFLRFKEPKTLKYRLRKDAEYIASCRQIRTAGRPEDVRGVLLMERWDGIVPRSIGHVRLSGPAQIIHRDPEPRNAGFIASCKHCQPCACRKIPQPPSAQNDPDTHIRRGGNSSLRESSHIISIRVITIPRSHRWNENDIHVRE